MTGVSGARYRGHMSKIRERLIGGGITLAVAGGAFWGITAANADDDVPPATEPSPTVTVAPKPTPTATPAPVITPTPEPPGATPAQPAAPEPAPAPEVTVPEQPAAPEPPAGSGGEIVVDTPQGPLDLSDMGPGSTGP